ncbi:MAG: Rieske 2Fe-2S domain-containing protein [Ktedonobacteraceae bacterium]
MSGEDQERFEDYLELEHYIDELQAGRVAHPPAELTPSQASIYRMAALFRSATPEAEEPRPEFAAELQARLEQELMQSPKAERPSGKPESAAGQRRPKKPAGISRRALLTGGAAVAASLAVGTGLGAVVEHSVNSQPPATPTTNTAYSLAIDKNVPKTWHFVTTLAELGKDAVRFAADAVIGYIIRDDGDDNDPDKGKIIAISATCTHMGCIVKWQASDRKFHCPCHGGQFTEYGMVDWGDSHIRYLRSLPRLNTKVENGNIYVEVPKSQL